MTNKRRFGMLLLALIVSVAGCSSKRLSYIIPAAAREQWIVVEFSNRNCLPLEHSLFGREIRVSRDGYACTSEDIPQGWMNVKYVVEEGLESKRDGEGEVSSPSRLTIERCNLQAVTFYFGSGPVRSDASAARLLKQHPECTAAIKVRMAGSVSIAHPNTESRDQAGIPKSVRAKTP